VRDNTEIQKEVFYFYMARAEVFGVDLSILNKISLQARINGR
jgi:hypothetical protein